MAEHLPKLEDIPVGEYAFPGELRDTLLGAILDGSKTATTSLFAEFDFDGSQIDGVGAREAIGDSYGNIVRDGEPQGRDPYSQGCHFGTRN